MSAVPHRQVGGDPVGRRINVVCHHHIHHDTAARRQAGTDGVASFGIELIHESKPGAADVDRNAVVMSRRRYNMNAAKISETRPIVTISGPGAIA